MTTDPQLPAVGKDIPGPAALCLVGTARLLERGNNRTRSVGRAVRRPCSDSEESDNDVWYAEEHDTTVQQVSRLKDWLTQMANNSCGEGCAQLDDFKCFLPAEERAGDLTTPESEIEMSDSESEVEYIEPDSTPLQTEATAQQLRCPPVVVQTRPIEGCHTAVPRQLCRGRDVLMEDGAVAVVTRQVSAASDLGKCIGNQNVARQLCLRWLQHFRPPPRLFSRNLEITVTRTHWWASVSIRPALILRMLWCPEWKWPVEVLRPELTLAEVRMRYRQRYL